MSHPSHPGDPAATEPGRPPPASRESPRAADDEQFLDRAFDDFVAALEEGGAIAAQQYLTSRPHLAEAITELQRLATDVAIGPRRDWPRLPGYRLVAELGRGGMGAVYLAHQERLGDRLVAVKFLPSGVAASPRARTRLISEAHGLGRLRHPHVVPVYDVLQDEHTIAYAMEWIDGLSLGELVGELAEKRNSDDGPPARRHSGTQASGHAGKTTRSFREPTLTDVRAALDPTAEDGGGSQWSGNYTTFICRIGLAIARALSAVHAAGLLHRDVKPSNILLRRDGTPLLSDFGLVREADATITQPGSFAGTPAYAAPEQLRGDSERIDARSDVYALGATLYHALALRLPLQGRSPTELLQQIEGAGPLPLRKLNSRLPVDLETIVSKAMEPDPARRYQTAAEMADDLERLLTLQPIRARPAGLMTRSIKLVRRNRGAFAGVIAGGFSALAVAALLFVYFVLMPRWAAQHSREARLALLDPSQANNIVSVLYWGRINAGGNEVRRARVSSINAALDRYSAALRLAPLDNQLRAERDAVVAARDALLSTATLSLPAMPSWPRAAAPSSVATSRTRGLYAFLSEDYETAIREWTAYESARDPLAPPDPLVSAALGVLYLFEDQPGRAYPRLRDAVRSFPNVGFLTLYLADAALKAGDLDHAERLLRDAASQPRRDTFGGPERVASGVLAARGRYAEAERAFGALRNNGPGMLDFARFLEERGRTDEALEMLMNAVRLGGPLPKKAYRAALEKWWSGLTAARRMSEIRASLDLGAYSARSLATRLKVYVESQQRRSRTPDDLLGSLLAALRRPVAPPLFFDVFAALCAALAAPSLQSLSPSELAQRMEVHDMSLWNQITSAPVPLRKLKHLAWRWPAPGALGRAAELAIHLHASPPAWLRASQRATLGTALMLAASATAIAQNCPNAPCFQGLGDLPGGAVESLSYRISSDGTTVVGQSVGAQGSESFRWRADTGMMGLGDLPGSSFFSRAEDVSADGNIVAGSSMSGSSGPWLEAFQWTSMSGLLALGDLPGDVYNSTTRAMSDDGAVIIGFSNSGSAARAFRWSGGALQELSVQAGWASLAFTLTPDGTIAYGHAGPDVNVSSGLCRWYGSGNFEYLGQFPPGGNIITVPYATTADGQMVVGYACTSTCTAFQWTQTGGFVALEGTGGASNAAALAISADGDLVGGYSGTHAVLWNAARQIVRVTDVLAQAGVSVPAGWHLTDIVDIAVNGSVITLCGNGTNPQGRQEAWIARYEPPTPCTKPPCFQGLGDLPGGASSSVPYAISSDGSSVVGASSSTNGSEAEAFRWRSSTGMVGLGDLPGDQYLSYAIGVNYDGSQVTGASWTSTSNGPQPRRAFLWTEADGMQPLADLDDFDGGVFSTEAGMSDAGIIFGASAGLPGYVPVRWQDANSVSRLSVDFPNPSAPDCVSRNGQWVAGTNGAANTYFLWSEATGILNFGPRTAYTSAVSDNGIVVGSQGGSGWRFNAGGSLTDLPDLPGGSNQTAALGINAVGDVILGRANSAFGDEAVVWTDEGQSIARVVDILVSAGVTIPSGWSLTAATDMTVSANVVAICGQGTNPQGHPEAWIARYTLPPQFTPGDMNCDGFVTVSDIAGFVLALTNPTQYDAQYPTCDINNGDVNGDSVVSVGDIGSFVALLVGG